jgi:NodT family efflux transporter outer membrane factor (OMF) lipoprotein
MRAFFFSRSWLGVALCALLYGCATEETLPVPATASPAVYRNAPAAPELPRPSTKWWREFENAELDRLEEMALANNRELLVAIARVAQANAQTRIAEAGLAPSIEAFGRRESQGPEGGVGTAGTRNEWHTLNRYQAGMRANYEVDLWGRQGYVVDSALAQAAASIHQREAVALTLTADLASAYLEYLSLGDRIAISERDLLSRRNALDAITKRVAQGDATLLEASQQRVALASAESAAASLVQRRERAFNRVALLAGVSPAELKLRGRGLRGVEIPQIHAGLPSELLCRRPDIRRIEAQLAGAQFDVRALRAGLLPSFSLNGEIGYGSRNLAAFASPASLFFLAAGTIAQSVFDAGRKEGQLELARARHLELLHQYTGALLIALREVEDALAGTRLTGEQHRALAEALEQARAGYAFSRKSFDVGAVDYLSLLEAEQRVIASEDATESALHDRMRAAIDLYRSLGGGTRTAEGDPCAP